MRKPFALLAALVGAFTLVLLGSLPASAHDELLSNTPKDGAALTAAPAAVVLRFEEPPLAGTTKLVATGDDGQQFPLTNPVAAGGVITTKWPAEKPAGTYKINWRNVGADGHPLTGTFSFSYTTAGQGPSASAGTTGAPDATAAATSPIPQASPVAATGPGGVGGTAWLLPTIAGIAVIVAAIFGFRAARKRKQHERPNT